MRLKFSYSKDREDLSVVLQGAKTGIEILRLSMDAGLSPEFICEELNKHLAKCKVIYDPLDKVIME